MRHLFKIPFLFLLIAAVLGVFLRYMMIAPIEGVTYSYILHAHSHIMFLGWIFNMLFLAFVQEFIGDRKFKRLFWVLQLLVVGMLIAFPLQGYALFSITFSALHTLGAFVFIIFFFRVTLKRTSLALSLAKYALLFFVLSSIGPFYLGYLKAHGLEHSNLYRFSLYFYLHFQYNGFFAFGVLSLFVRFFEDRLSSDDLHSLRLGSHILLVACLPAYLLSILWAQPEFVYNIVGSLSAIAQGIGAIIILRALKRRHFITRQFERGAQTLLVISAGAFVLKLSLQLISAIPAAAGLANEMRPVVIGYLHLVLIGFVSLFLLAWAIEKKIITTRILPAVAIFVIAFAISEILLIILPWSETYFSLQASLINRILFVLSAAMAGAIIPLTISAFRNAR